MSNYRRARVPGGTYFFTVNRLERRRRLLMEHVDLLGDAFRTTRVARPFVFLAWVILPDHLHLHLAVAGGRCRQRQPLGADQGWLLTPAAHHRTPLRLSRVAP